MPQASHAKKQLEAIWKTPGHLKWHQVSIHGQQNQDPGVSKKYLFRDTYPQE